MMFTKTKIILCKLIIGLNIYSLYAQEMQAFLKLNDQTPPIVVDAWDRNDPSLIFWNDQIITWGLPVKHFYTFILPFELLGQENEINSQVDEILVDWNSQYCIELYLDDAGNSVDLAFSTDEIYFGPDGASGYTALPVTLVSGNYKFHLYNASSLTVDDKAAIYLNYSASHPYTWTIQENYVNSTTQPFKRVLLHEMGHLIGLGHSLYPCNEAVMVQINFMNQQCFLFQVQTADREGMNEYCEFQNLVVGIEDELVITGPQNVTQNSIRTYTATFYNEGEYNWIISNHNWELNVLHSEGSYTLATGTTPLNDITWDVNIGTLPNGYCWLRNYENKVIAVVKVNAYDDGFFTHYDTYYIYFTDIPLNTTSGYLMNNETWCGDITITGMITVHSALTLTIKPNTNITFQNNASLIVQGTLNASGCELNGGTGTWGSIYFFGTASTNSVLDNVVIRNGGGIKCYSGANVVIKNSDIINCTEGVYIYNSQPQILTNQILQPVQNGINVDASGYSPLILHNTITKTSGNPTYRNYQGIIFANNTNGYIAHNDISGFAWGSYIGGGSDAIFSNSSYQQFNPNNRFRDNSIGIGAGWGGTIIATVGLSNSRFNSIYNNSVYDARSYQYSYLYARNNWWGIDGAQVNVDGTSLLDASNPLFSDPWNPYEENGMDIISINNNPEEGGGNPDSSILSGLSLEREERIVEAILHYKRMVSDNVVPGFALGRLVGIKHKYQIQNIREYLETLLTGNRPYRPFALALFAGLLMGEDKYEQAMFLYNKIITDYPGSYHSVNALFAKFFAALNYENNRVLAGEILQELEALNLEDEEYLMRLSIAQNLFNEGGTEYLGKSNDQIASNQQTELPKEYSLLGNYPNPFNPSTNISYTLPYSSSVELIIYDIMGREIKSFNIGSQPSGYQTLIWNGTNEEGVSVSSGVYLYRMKIKSLENNKVFVKSSKLVLLK